MKILEATATQKNHGISLFIHAKAIIKNEKSVKQVTMPTLVKCGILTQHAPFTNLDEAPKVIIKKRKSPIKLSCPKSLARSEAAAYTNVYPLLLKTPTRKRAMKNVPLLFSTLWFRVSPPSVCDLLSRSLSCGTNSKSLSFGGTKSSEYGVY